MISYTPIPTLRNLGILGVASSLFRKLGKARIRSSNRRFTVVSFVCIERLFSKQAVEKRQGIPCGFLFFL